MPNVNKLTAKEKKFVKLYVGKHYNNATQSYIEAYDYTGNNATHLGYQCRSRLHVAAAINRALDREDIAKPNEILSYLTSIIRDERVDEQAIIVGRGDGVQEVEKHYVSPNTATKRQAAVDLAKLLGMEKHKIEVSMPTFIDDVDDDEDDLN